MRWLSPILIAAALGAPARADDDEADDSDAVTRHWRVHVQIDDSKHHEGTTSSDHVTTKVEAHGGFDVELGTADGDVTGNAWAWERASGKPAATGAMTDEMTVVSDGHTYITRFTGKADPARSAVQCKYTEQSWQCSAGIAYVGTEEGIADGKVVTSRPLSKSQAAMFGGGKISVFANAKTATVTKQGERFTFHNDWTAKEAHQITDVRIEPLDKVGYEAVFVVGADYDHFIPEGPPIKEPKKPGNSLALHIELRDAKTHRRSAKQFSAVVTLDASRLPGTCMNFPPYGEDTPDEPDLYFDDAKNRSGKVRDPVILELPMGHGSAQITVTSRDYGAIGKLTAHVKVADGAELEATLADGHEVLAIPRDDNNNHIADWWETQKAITGGRESNTDDEALPRGMKVDGDGYTLFEEYRGFVQADPAGPRVIQAGPKPQFTRLDPNKRDVFIGVSAKDPKDQAVILDGLAGFAEMNSAELHFVAAPDFLAPLPGDYYATFSRRVDLRSDAPAELFGKPQAAIWIATGIPTDNDSPAFAWNMVGDGDKSKKVGDLSAETKAFGSPKDVKMIVVQRKRALETADGLRCYVDPDCKVGKSAQGRKDQFDAGLSPWLTPSQRRNIAKGATAQLDVLTERVMRFTIIHELGHTLGAYHHGRIGMDESGGDTTCPMRYWQSSTDWHAIIAFLGGVWTLQRSQDGTPWKWCDENLPQMRFRDGN